MNEQDPWDFDEALDELCNKGQVDVVYFPPGWFLPGVLVFLWGIADLIWNVLRLFT